ncbi:hypothetical protein GCM10017600_44710 [Streptosporangium carneum]|uniref:Integrase n=1 Tax=Streptosporangium carneum TaxID=47481 RepID=A0A9W6MEK3_9ACTN|nr:hypothetical protein GCM10017600_44710 [Streptosporangium carneum]
MRADLDGTPPSIMVGRSVRECGDTKTRKSRRRTPASRWEASPVWVGHRNASVTETVYRKQLRPMLLEGAEAMGQVFGNRTVHSVGHAATKKGCSYEPGAAFTLGWP